MKIIINADDCGSTQKANERIEEFILKGKISSTTIMANRDDLAGAVRLYDTYKDKISFGIHLNLDSGHPIVYSQIMADYGFYDKTGLGFVYMGGGKQLRNKVLCKELCSAIADELLAQISVLRDNGISISHIDSHHGIHYGIALTPIMPIVMQKSGIKVIRRRPNLSGSLKYGLLSSLWAGYTKSKIKDVRVADYYGSVGEWICLTDKVKRNMKGSVELMAHPNISKGVYQKENDFLMEWNIQNEPTIQLISYNEL